MFMFVSLSYKMLKAPLMSFYMYAPTYTWRTPFYYINEIIYSMNSFSITSLYLYAFCLTY